MGTHTSTKTTHFLKVTLQVRPVTLQNPETPSPHSCLVQLKLEANCAWGVRTQILGVPAIWRSLHSLPRPHGYSSAHYINIACYMFIFPIGLKQTPSLTSQKTLSAFGGHTAVSYAMTYPWEDRRDIWKSGHCRPLFTIMVGYGEGETSPSKKKTWLACSFSVDWLFSWFASQLSPLLRYPALHRLPWKGAHFINSWADSQHHPSHKPEILM